MLFIFWFFDEEIRMRECSSLVGNVRGNFVEYYIDLGGFELISYYDKVI